MKLTACPKRYFLETLLSAFRLNELGLESFHAEVSRNGGVAFFSITPNPESMRDTIAFCKS
jgi:hypothetical protein